MKIINYYNSNSIRIISNNLQTIPNNLKMMCNATESFFTQSAVSVVATVLTANDQSQCYAWDLQYPFVYFFIYLTIKNMFDTRDFTKLDYQEQETEYLRYAFVTCFNLILGLCLYNLTISCSHPTSWLVYVAMNQSLITFEIIKNRK